MADTNFQPGTIVASSWLRDANTVTYPTLAAVAGTNTITATGASTVTVGYPRGVAFRFIPQNNNTGAVTVNINGLGAKAVTKLGATPLVANDLLAGNWAYITYDGTQFQLINPGTGVPFSGILPVINGGNGIGVIQPVGNCRLVKSGANLVLQPYQGNILAFNAGYATIPAAGVSLAPTALAVGSNFYIYAVQTAGVVTSLEASATGHSTDATTGIEVKTGDATRVLVGFARTITGPAWQDTLAQRFVLSWFNQRSKELVVPFANPTTTVATSLTELSVSNRIEFLTWANTQCIGNSVGWSLTSGGVGQIVTTAYAFDGVVQEGGSLQNSPAASAIAPYHVFARNSTLAEGYHYGTVLGSVQSGTGTWNNSGSTGTRPANMGTIQG